MPTIEVNFDIEEARIALKELDDFLDNDVNKQMITNAMSYNMSQSPPRYYKLRDEIMPSYLGENANKGLFWFLLGGWSLSDEHAKLLSDIKGDNVTFLNYLFTNYTKDILVAKKHTLNPLGFDELYFSRGGDNGYNNLVISRNDEQRFLLSLNSVTFLDLIENMAMYYSELVLAEGRILQPEEVNTIDKVIDSLKNMRGVNNE